MISIHTLVVSLRKLRSLHKIFGISIALFLVITACTGILLGWKKNIGTLQPPTKQGSSEDLAKWKSFNDISVAARSAMDSAGQQHNEIDRFDVRPESGVVKVLFKEGYWEVQVEGASGKILSMAQRHSDWIEHLHDGSIINEFFKLLYTNLLGFGLLVLAVTGVYMWLTPKIIRRYKSLRK